MEVLTLGGIVSRMLVPNTQSGHTDVVLGFNELEPYLDGRSSYAGAITGRIAGRVPDGIIRVEGREYQLLKNDGQNHLHGGGIGLDKRIWKVQQVDRADGAPSLQLAYTSPQGEEGYPGTIEFSVTYTVTNENAFQIETVAKSDSPTPVSLTHHGYFNLAGEGSGSIEEHELAIFSNEIVDRSEDMTLNGKCVPVSGLPCDLNERKRLGAIIPGLFNQHGDLYRIRRPADATGLVKAARLYHPGSGIAMEVETTNTFLQLYTGVHLEGTVCGKSGQAYDRHAGLCLEAEEYPAATTHVGLGNILVYPDAPQRHTTLYRFITAPNPGGTSA